MTMLDRISKGMSVRSGDNPVIRQLFGGLQITNDDNSGQAVTVDRALGLPAVFAANSMIANVGGTLPLITYAGSDRNRATDAPVYKLLHDQPNPETPAAMFWPDVLLNYCGWGNAYIGKSRIGPRVAELWCLPSDRVEVKRKNGKLIYVERLPNGDRRRWDAADIIHIRNISRDGILGLSPIAVARESMGSALSMRRHKARFFRDWGIPPGALSTDQDLEPATKDKIRAEWRKRHTDRREIAILDNGTEFKTLSIPLQDMQFVELEGLSVADVARIYTMPASMLGAATGDSLTYGNREDDMRQFSTVTLAGPLMRLESALRSDPELMPQDHYCRFKREALMQANYMERMQGYRIATGNRAWMLPEEVRSAEDLPELEPEQQLPSAPGPAPVETISN